MQSRHDSFQYPFSTPLFVMPEDGGVRGQVFGQITPIAAILELIEDAIEDLSFAPTGWSSFLLLGQ
jgi:hypothetical protein